MDDIVLLHHFASISLKLLDPSLLGLSGLYVPLFQVSEYPDNCQRNCPLRGPQIQGLRPRLSSATKQAPSS